MFSPDQAQLAIEAFVKQLAATMHDVKKVTMSMHDETMRTALVNQTRDYAKRLGYVASVTVFPQDKAVFIELTPIGDMLSFTVDLSDVKT